MLLQTLQITTTVGLFWLAPRHWHGPMLMVVMLLSPLLARSAATYIPALDPLVMGSVYTIVAVLIFERLADARQSEKEWDEMLRQRRRPAK